MAVPDRILHKPGPLDEEEWAVMKKHTLCAYEMIKDINFLEKSYNIPRYHHENWDGSGYPYGLREKEIPLEARIFAIVDSWDAMLSERPYKKSLSPQESLRSIQEEAGRKYDPELVKLFEAFIIPYYNLGKDGK
jgi:HD-GYP domain-containing protein (c-di-GMP phosphodiesterase class II)